MNEKIESASFQEAKEYMASLPFIDNTDELKKLLENFIHISDNSKALEYLKQGIMPCKIGNLKIGNDTLIININHSLNCFSDKNGYCENCNHCYAKKSSYMYKNSFLYGFASEIQFDKLSIKEIIKSIEKQYIKELNSNSIKFIRWNESGDFKSFKAFKKANEVSKYFKNKYGIIAYSYTHNKELETHKEFIKNSFITINWSFCMNNNYKQAITCNDVKQLDKYYNDDNYIICLGNCSNCSYCKDRNDLRTIIFINHYTKAIKELLQQGLTSNQLKELKANKYIDYGNFLKSLIE